MRRGHVSPEIERWSSDLSTNSSPTTIPIPIRSRLPDPKWSISRFLEYKELPPLADQDAIVTEPTLSTRLPSEPDHHVPRIPVPNDKDWLIDLRKRLQTAVAHGQRSIVSPFGGSARFPLWAAGYWVEVDIFHRKRARYLEANAWMQHHRSTMPSNLIARVHTGWQSFTWSKLNEKLKGPESHVLPDPDELLTLLSDRWFEDLLMEVMITLLSLEIQRRKITHVRILPLQFWRELEHLQASEGQWNELHYPQLANARAIVEQGYEVCFIISDLSRSNPMGSHWTACVLNVGRREYRFADSFGHDPPPSLQPRLEHWLHWGEVLDNNEHLQRGQDLDHNMQRDAYSCGFIAMNVLEHYVNKKSKLWDETSNATLRVTKYINLLEFNGIDRGSPLMAPPHGNTPIRPRASSASSVGSRSSALSRSTSRSHADPILGDVPFEGDDLNHLRGWTQGEGSRYAAIPPPRSDGERSRSGSRASSMRSREEDEASADHRPVPDLVHQGMPVFRNGGDRLRVPGANGNVPATDSPKSQNSNSIPPNINSNSPPPVPPKLSPSPAPDQYQPVQRSRPLRANPIPISGGGGSARNRVPVPQPPPEEPIIPSNEWANTGVPIPAGMSHASSMGIPMSMSGVGGMNMGTERPPGDERGRRPRPITPPSRPPSTTHGASINNTTGGVPFPAGFDGNGRSGFLPVFPDISPPNGTGVNGLYPPPGVSEPSLGANASSGASWGAGWPVSAHSDAPIIPNGVNGFKPSPPSPMSVPFPTPISNSKPPRGLRRMGNNNNSNNTQHARSPSEQVLTTPSKPPTRDRTRRGSGSSLSSIWKTVRGKIASTQGALAPGPPVRPQSSAGNHSHNTGGAVVPATGTSAPALLAPPSPRQQLQLTAPEPTTEPIVPYLPRSHSQSALSDNSESAVPSQSSPGSFRRARTLSQSSGVSGASSHMTSGTEDRGRSEFAGSVRSRKSSMKSLERRPGEPRVPGLKVNFSHADDLRDGPKSPRNIAAVDQKREGATIRKARGTTPPGTPLLRGKKRSTYEAREAVIPPPHFNLNDPTLASQRRQDTIEKRHDVVIDQEPSRLIVYGARLAVTAAVRELHLAFREFAEGNMSQKLYVSKRAAHRIGLWAICQRLQNETGTRIVVADTIVTINGPKHLLSSAYHKIKAFGTQVDDEKHTHYLVPSSKDLRRVLMIELPRLIAAGGGPQDEEEARQMFTISNPGDGAGQEMVVDLWCHPNMSKALTEGLKKTVDEFTTYRARDVWGMRASPWKLHALRNSHIFRRYDDPVNSPEGSEIVDLHTIEKRLHVNFLFPDDKDRPPWDTIALRNVTNIPKEYTVKIRGSQAQIPAAIAELEDRMRRLIQVAVRVPSSFHKDLKSGRVARRLASLGVDCDIKPPSGEYFECTLSATRKEDLEVGQSEVSRMAGRIAKGQPAVERDSKDSNMTTDESEREPNSRLSRPQLR